MIESTYAFSLLGQTLSLLGQPICLVVVFNTTKGPVRLFVQIVTVFVQIVTKYT
jgi:hypothetical protein